MFIEQEFALAFSRRDWGCRRPGSLNLAKPREGEAKGAALLPSKQGLMMP